MAADEDEQQTEDSSEAQKKSGGLKKIILLAVIGLVIIGASVGGTIAVLSMMKEEPVVEADEEAVEQEAEPPAKPAIYYPLKPEYILNIDARGKRRFMRLDLTLMTRDDDVIAAIELHRPTIDNTVNLIAGGQIYEEIQTAEGKEFLRLQLLQELQAMFEKEIGKPGLEQVLFTNFVVQ